METQTISETFWKCSVWHWNKFLLRIEGKKKIQTKQSKTFCPSDLKIVICFYDLFEETSCLYSYLYFYLYFYHEIFFFDSYSYFCFSAYFNSYLQSTKKDPKRKGLVFSKCNLGVEDNTLFLFVRVFFCYFFTLFLYRKLKKQSIFHLLEY